jgi:hypothetical protein
LKVLVDLLEMRVKTPFLASLLLQSRVEVAHVADEAHNSGQLGKVSRNLQLVFMSPSRVVEVDRIWIDGKIMASLWCSNHDFADKDRLPYPRSKLAFGLARFTRSAGLVILEMLIQSQVLGHLDALHNRHPRAEEVATLWCCLAGLQYHQQGLESAESRNIHKRIGMP